MMIAILTQDLMMSAKVREAAAHYQCDYRVFRSAEELSTFAEQATFRWLLVDLQIPGLDICQLSNVLVSPDEPRLFTTIGYAQHVRTDLLKQGKIEGLDRVVTRGKIMNELIEILK